MSMTEAGNGCAQVLLCVHGPTTLYLHRRIHVCAEMIPTHTHTHTHTRTHARTHARTQRSRRSVDRRPKDDKSSYHLSTMRIHLITNSIRNLINIMSLSAGTPNSLISAPGTKTLCDERKTSDRIRIRRAEKRERAKRRMHNDV